MYRLVKECNCTPDEAIAVIRNNPYLRDFLNLCSYMGAKHEIDRQVAQQKAKNQKKKEDKYPDGYWVKMYDRPEERITLANRRTQSGEEGESIEDLIKEAYGG